VADHAAHDPLLVAAAADRGGRLPADLAACPACTSLHAELVAIAAAVPTSALPARPRDYTLTPADAARLRPGGWRRWLAAIGSARDVVTRPLAIGFTTLGLAGLLVATVPGALPGGDGGALLAPIGDAARSAAPAAVPGELSPEPMTMSQAPASEASPASPVDEDGVFSGVDAGDPEASDTAGGGQEGQPAPVDEVDVRDDASGLSTLVVVAGLLLIVGLGLFGLRWSARRL
jgi:hypothetical protein